MAYFCVRRPYEITAYSRLPGNNVGTLGACSGANEGRAQAGRESSCRGCQKTSREEASGPSGKTSEAGGASGETSGIGINCHPGCRPEGSYSRAARVGHG
jgi:hypothetical protein